MLLIKGAPGEPGGRRGCRGGVGAGSRAPGGAGREEGVTRRCRCLSSDRPWRG